MGQVKSYSKGFYDALDKQYVFCVTGSGYEQNIDTINTILTSLSL